MLERASSHQRRKSCGLRTGTDGKVDVEGKKHFKLSVWVDGQWSALKSRGGFPPAQETLLTLLWCKALSLVLAVAGTSPLDSSGLHKRAAVEPDFRLSPWLYLPLLHPDAQIHNTAGSLLSLSSASWAPRVGTPRWFCSHHIGLLLNTCKASQWSPSTSCEHVIRSYYSLA